MPFQSLSKNSKAVQCCANTRFRIIGVWIVGALRNLGHEVSHQTVANLLKRHDIAPAAERERSMSWREFIRSHLEVLADVDFFTAEVWPSK